MDCPQAHAHTHTHTHTHTHSCSPSLLVLKHKVSVCWCIQGLWGRELCSRRLFYRLSQIVQGYGDQDPALCCKDSAFLCGRRGHSLALCLSLSLSFSLFIHSPSTLAAQAQPEHHINAAPFQVMRGYWMVNKCLEILAELVQQSSPPSSLKHQTKGVSFGRVVSIRGEDLQKAQEHLYLTCSDSRCVCAL